MVLEMTTIGLKVPEMAENVVKTAGNGFEMATEWLKCQINIMK